MKFRYSSGEDIIEGDSIRYQGEAGHVEFVATGDNPAYAWYLEEFPGGGVMIATPSFGSLFLGVEDIDEALVFCARREP